MDAFWMSWQDLSAHPESEAVRSVVAQRGMALADAINHTDRQLTELKEDLNATVKVKVDEINSIALQLKDLNQQILSIKIAGKQPNDLLDKRDLLIDQLSEIVDVQVSEDNRTSMVTVQLGGRNLVQDVYYNPLDVKSDTEGMHMVTWQDTGVKASISSGELRGVLDARGKTLDEASPSEYKELIPNLMDQLNILAKTIVVKTNDLHRQGYSLNNHKTYPDGKDFFNMPVDPNFENWAEFMQVSDAIVNDVKNIAAASHKTWDVNTKVNFGDGSNAMDIAGLKHFLNSDEYWTKSAELNFDFPDETLSGLIKVNYNGSAIDINISFDSSNPCDDLQELAEAIQTQLDDKQVNVRVRCDGKNLVFYSDSKDFGGISGDLITEFDSLKSKTGMIQYVTNDDSWRSITAEIGVKSQEAIRMAKNQKVLLSQLESKRQSVSGVALDEEITNMIKFQHAYNASSRYITTIDETLDVIINRMGVVGR